jgi:hypothetical protein
VIDFSAEHTSHDLALVLTTEELLTVYAILNTATTTGE